MHGSNKKASNKKIYLLIVLAIVAISAEIMIFESKSAGANKSQFNNPDVDLNFQNINPETNNDSPIKEKIFGYSERKRPIMGYEIGFGKNILMFIGAIHADESGTADLMNRLVEEIKKDPNIVSKTKKLVIIPISNPDGYYEKIYKLNANGVNLNINFDTPDWETMGPEGTFAGDEPFSEAESRTIRKVVEKYIPSLFISFHSYGAVVTPSDHKLSEEISNWYAEKTGYRFFDDWPYDYFGTATEWFTKTTGNPALTVELTYKQESDWEINKPALMDLISSDSDSFTN